MTAVFAAFTAASVAVTGASPLSTVLFSVAAILLSFLKPKNRYGFPAAILLITFCAVTLPLTVAATVWACCIVTALVVKRNYYYSFSLLLIIGFIISMLGISKENPLSLPQTALLFLLPYAAYAVPESKVRALCISLAVSLPISFGGGRIQTICLLLPALMPVLIGTWHGIEFNGRKHNADKKNIKRDRRKRSCIYKSVISRFQKQE